MIVKDQKTGRKKDVRLPKSFKKRWIEALRSDKFKQGTGVLHNTTKNTYCCLGVACRIIHPRKDFKNSGTLSSYNTKSIKIPDILKGDNSKKSYDYNPVVDKLINMNDMLDKDFNQIANWIEKNL